VAARYLLQENVTSSGGDWFDAIPLGDGRLALVVGDVVGSGVLASAIMGQLRAVLHERLASGASGPEALVALDRFARGLPEAHAATACVAHLDTETGELVYCTAGHPPPLVLDSDGHTHYLRGTGGRPLGVSHRAATVEDFPVLQERLGHDAMVLLYSDGAVERPGRSFAESTVELARVVSSIRETSLDADAVGQLEVDRVCERSLGVLAWLSGYDDDITILAAQRAPRVVPLDIRLPAEPASADPLRTELGAWLDSLALSELDRTVLVHAANELASNAIDHAYPHARDDGAPPGAVVELHADLLPTGVVEVTVCDRGRWRDPDLREQYRGRGLALTAGLVDELDVSQGGDAAGRGTVAKIRHRVRRAASLLSPMTGRAPHPHPRDVPFSLSTDEHEHRVDVAGAVDEVSSDRLLAVLRTMSRGGAVTVTADLSAVTQLPSVAVRALYEAHGQMQGGAELRLVAEMGSPAQHVLDIVGLPYGS
jgi:anti-sigma regulatory factor (Ser/Thr protein kinase)